jgi:hypothetical protein
MLSLLAVPVQKDKQRHALPLLPLTVADCYDAPEQQHLMYADVCWRMLTYADVCWRMLTYSDLCWRMLTYDDDVCSSRFLRCTWEQQHRSRAQRLQHMRMRLRNLVFRINICPTRLRRQWWKECRKCGTSCWLLSCRFLCMHVYMYVCMHTGLSSCFPCPFSICLCFCGPFRIHSHELVPRSSLVPSHLRPLLHTAWAMRSLMLLSYAISLTQSMQISRLSFLVWSHVSHLKKSLACLLQIFLLCSLEILTIFSGICIRNSS